MDFCFLQLFSINFMQIKIIPSQYNENSVVYFIRNSN